MGFQHTIWRHAVATYGCSLCNALPGLPCRTLTTHKVCTFPHAPRRDAETRDRQRRTK
jgi:hypothetical protein